GPHAAALRRAAGTRVRRVPASARVRLIGRCGAVAGALAQWSATRPGVCWHRRPPRACAMRAANAHLVAATLQARRAAYLYTRPAFARRTQAALCGVRATPIRASAMGCAGNGQRGVSYNKQEDAGASGANPGGL